MVRDTGFEPVTPSVSGRGLARVFIESTGKNRWFYKEYGLLKNKGISAFCALFSTVKLAQYPHGKKTKIRGGTRDLQTG